ncbi:MAG: hypothetical protein OMM_14157, partial [Candidatus Magnetoglobus multicellularis str. Araruama]
MSTRTNGEDANLNPGNAGNINISANQILLEDGAQLDSSTQGIGNGGDIIIQNANRIIMGNESLSEPDENGRASITSQSGFEEADAGKAGNIIINTDNLEIKYASWIGASTKGGGDGGNISINVANDFILNGYNYPKSSIVYTSSDSDQSYAGNAGNIIINAKNLKLLNHSEVSTSAKHAGGGSISLGVDKMLYLSNSKITSSVQKGDDNSGNINIYADQTLMNKSSIVATAYEGNGGNININGNNFIQSSDSLIDASSKLGIDGKVDTIPPNVEFSSQLVQLPSNFLDAVHWLQTPCADRSSEDISRFIIDTQIALPQLPDDLLPAPFYLSIIKVIRPYK